MTRRFYQDKNNKRTLDLLKSLAEVVYLPQMNAPLTSEQALTNVAEALTHALDMCRKSPDIMAGLQYKINASREKSST